VPLYIETTNPDVCSPLLVQVQRDGQSVNVSGAPGCGASCQQIMDEGWPYSPGRTTPMCLDPDCVRPAPVRIEAGQTLQQPATLEVVAQQLPRACAAGITSDNIECFARVIPQPGNYTLSVRASAQLQCDAPNCDCVPNATGACTNLNVALTNAPLVFNFPSTWYFQNQELQIAAPGN